MVIQCSDNHSRVEGMYTSKVVIGSSGKLATNYENRIGAGF